MAEVAGFVRSIRSTLEWAIVFAPRPWVGEHKPVAPAESSDWQIGGTRRFLVSFWTRRI